MRHAAKKLTRFGKKAVWEAFSSRVKFGEHDSSRRIIWVYFVLNNNLNQPGTSFINLVIIESKFIYYIS